MARVLITDEIDPRSTPEYREGLAAYGPRRRDACPYPSGAKRLAWYCGWYDARTGVRLARVFKKWGIEWP